MTVEEWIDKAPKSVKIFAIAFLVSMLPNAYIGFRYLIQDIISIIRFGG